MSFQNPKSELFAISVLDKENKYIFCVVSILFNCIFKILVKGNGLFLHQNSCINKPCLPIYGLQENAERVKKKVNTT